MAIVSCPFCGKKVSNKSQSCQYCGNTLGEVSPEAAEKAHREIRYKQARSINNHAMLSVVLFLASFLYYYFWQPEHGSWQLDVNYLVMGCAGLGYVISKARMVMFKRK